MAKDNQELKTYYIYHGMDPYNVIEFHAYTENYFNFKQFLRYTVPLFLSCPENGEIITIQAFGVYDLFNKFSDLFPTESMIDEEDCICIWESNIDSSCVIYFTDRLQESILEMLSYSIETCFMRDYNLTMQELCLYRPYLRLTPEMEKLFRLYFRKFLPIQMMMLGDVGVFDDYFWEYDYTLPEDVKNEFDLYFGGDGVNDAMIRHHYSDVFWESADYVMMFRYILKREGWGEYGG